MKTNVQVTAVKKVLENGLEGYEVKVEGMEGRLQCKRFITDPYRAMKYMWLLSKRLQLRINNIDLAAVSLDYRRAKEAEDKAVEDANSAIAELDETPAEQEEQTAPEESVEVAPVISESSLLEQFEKLKANNPEPIQLLRTGDFYTALKEDAKILADVLGVTLARHNDIESAAFPHHALDSYLPRLIRAGHRVAVSDEIVETPKKRRGRKPKAEA